MHDNHKLQLAIYRLLLFGEDQLIIFKGEKEMGCKERSEHECKSYPKCDGCNAHTKDLTFKHRFPHSTYKDGEWDTVADSTAGCKVHDSGEKELYLMGPIVDRLHEFEKLGYEPEDLKRIIERHHEMNRYSRDAFDALYYAYKKAGDIENSLCDDICSMYPSTLLSPSGFINYYVKNEEFRKLVAKRIKRVMEKMTPLKDAIDEKIVEAITRPVDYQKVWVTTSSSIKDDELMKKLKEIQDDLFRTTGVPKSILDSPDSNRTRDIYNYILYDTKVTNEMCRVLQNKKEKAPMTVTPNPEYQFKIKRVLFNNPATIVFWADGDKTVVKCQNNEPYDPEKGLAMAISKKALGNDRAYYNTFAKHCKNKVSEVANVSDLHDMMEDNKTYRALAADAIDYLKEVVSDPHATKVNMAHAMNHAMECLKAILED